jgi:hypothetical protein
MIPCEGCPHPPHPGRECGGLKTEDIDDTVGLSGPPSGQIYTIVTGICRCGRQRPGHPKEVGR